MTDKTDCMDTFVALGNASTRIDPFTNSNCNANAERFQHEIDRVSSYRPVICSYGPPSSRQGKVGQSFIF